MPTLRMNKFFVYKVGISKYMQSERASDKELSNASRWPSVSPLERVSVFLFYIDAQNSVPFIIQTFQ